MTKLAIIFEDEQMLVLEKEAGLVVNRSETIKEETLQDQLSEYFRLGNDLGLGSRAGIVHRLDRETSGLLIVAKTQKAFDNLQSQFKARTVKKEYLALVHGHLTNEGGSITGGIGRIGKFGKFGIARGGRESKTDFEVIGRFKFKSNEFEKLISENSIKKPQARYLINQATLYTYLKLLPRTGRTHQVRVHVKSIGHPVVSDLIYAPRKLLKFELLWCPRLFLHASILEITHPKTKARKEFKSDLPKDLKDAISNLTIDN